MSCDFRHYLQNAIQCGNFNYWEANLWVKNRAYGKDTPACMRKPTELIDHKELTN